MPLVACDMARMQAGDLAACAHYIRTGLDERDVILWVPEGSDISLAETVFSLYSIKAHVVELGAPRGYRRDAPATCIASFGLEVMEKAWSDKRPHLIAPTAGAPAYFAAQNQLPTTLVLGSGGLVEQMEARAFPESNDDVVFLEMEAQAARRAKSVMASDALLADSYQRLTGVAVAASEPISDAYTYTARSGAILIAPTEGLTDDALAVSVLARAAELGDVDVLIADTMLAADGQSRAMSQALKQLGVTAKVAGFERINQVLERSRDDQRSILSLRDMRALDPAGAWAVAHGAPVIAGIGAQFNAPGDGPGSVRMAVSHPNKLAPLIVDADASFTWPRPALESVDTAPSMTATIKRFSVVIATHARPAMLDEALKSLAEASDFPGEVIVVDDGSAEDLSAENAKVCDAFTACPIRYERTDNLYPGHARNTGAELASGDWLYFLDDDNRLHGEALAQIKVWQSATGADALFSFMTGFGPDAPEGMIPFFGPLGAASIFENHAADTGFAISKAAFVRVGGFPETYGVGKEDYAMALRLARSDVDWALIPDPLYAYRIHDNRIRKKHRARAANSFLPLSSVLPITDGEGRLSHTGLLERLAFMQAEQLALRHVPDRKGLRLSPWAVFVHHVLRPVMRGSSALRGAVTGNGVIGSLVRAVFFRRQG